MSRLKPFAAWLIALLLLFPQLAVTQVREGGGAKLLFDLVNHERAARGLPLLRWDEALAQSAQEHAWRMAERNSISHQFPGEPDLAARARQTGARFVALAENVAEGPSTPGMHQQLMHSPHHRDNILDPQLNSLGVAIAQRNGQLFAVQDFSEAVPELSFEEQENEVGAQLKKRGLRLLEDNGDARRLCKLTRGEELVHATKPTYLLRYSAAELRVLPDILVRELASGRYHAATVAACAASPPTDFSGYQVSVLLYE